MIFLQKCIKFEQLTFSK